jgi:general stress protein CsbA
MPYGPLNLDVDNNPIVSPDDVPSCVDPDPAIVYILFAVITWPKYVFDIIGINFILLFPVSVMYTFPNVSTHIPYGKFNLDVTNAPLTSPCVDPAIVYILFAVITWPKYVFDITGINFIL